VPFLWSQTGPISLSIGPGKDRGGRAQLPRRARLPLLAGHLRPPPGTPVAKLDSPTFLSYCGDGSACFFTALVPSQFITIPHQLLRAVRFQFR
jgi:hypothetical protein